MSKELNNINEIRSYKKIQRHETRKIFVGDVAIGGGEQIKVQSMTNSLTTDVNSTLKQINQCFEAGADLMRVSVPDKQSSAALKEIIKNSPIPIIADIHFHYKRAIESAIAGAKCLRINPGNIGSEDKIKEVIKAAKDYGCSIRIGVNAGSLENDILQKHKTPTPEALLESAQRHLKILEDNDFFETKISVKASDVMLAVRSYELLAKKCDYPLHIGITESGSMFSGSIRSSIGLGYLLMQGIGDTIRVSLSAPPVEEIKTAYQILKSLNLRTRGINIISCPSCARQAFDVIKIVEEVEKRVSHISKPLDVSILGCVVNGLGEAAHTKIGITGGGNQKHNVYIDGQPNHKVHSEELVDHIVELIKKKVEKG